MTLAQIIAFIVGPVAAYLLGSIPFGLVIGLSKGVDIRTVGSKNIGATNLGRTLGMKYFWMAFLLDAAKGFLPVFVVSLLLPWLTRGGEAGDALPSWAPLVSGAAAMLGHLYPVWLKFKGGKGVATGFGIVLGLWPLFTVAGLIAAATFVVIFMVWRYISLASMLGAVAFAIYVWLLGTQVEFFKHESGEVWPLVWVAAGFAVLIIIKHRTNIGRLMKGTENKFGVKKS
jgi:glycerol-3-phosphate acyltransferase PlsY